MTIGRSALALLLVASSAARLRAQSYDEAESANASALKQVALLNRADGDLRRWLAANAEAVGLEVQVDEIGSLMKGWRNYTSIECDFIGLTTGGNAASKATYTSMCEERRYIARLQVLNEAKKCLTRLLRKSEHESLYASTCLEPLTPLKTSSDYQG